MNNPINWIDPLGLFRSPDYLRYTVPGQVLYDQGMTALENRSYGWAALDFAGMAAEQVLFVLTLGQSMTARGAATACEVGVASTAAKTATGLWPSPASGRQVINGIEYTREALSRMAPSGLIQKGTEIVSRGVPPSVVENAVQFGTKSPGNTPGTIVHTFENVIVVTNQLGNRVITVIRTGH